MARVLRTELPDGFFHLTARSVQETMLFGDDEDRHAFLTLLLRAVLRWRLDLHVYCLLGTHYHALVNAPTERISPALQWAQSRYAREHNARFGRRGALFAGRFSS